jgi:MFS family permease
VSTALLTSRRLPSPLDFALAAGLTALALFASATPTPLYADYATRWHFSTPVLTAVYATYAIAVLTALLLIGRLSDDVGRRPVLQWALVGLLGATLLFMAARSVEWLFAARALRCSTCTRAATRSTSGWSTAWARPWAWPPARWSPRRWCRRRRSRA